MNIDIGAQPGSDAIEPFDAVAGFAAAQHVVALTEEVEQLHRLLQRQQRGEHLLGLHEGAEVILLGVL
jgi:hypothetical protein